MTVTPILCAFMLAMSLFGAWLYCVMADSLRREVDRSRALLQLPTAEVTMWPEPASSDVGSPPRADRRREVA